MPILLLQLCSLGCLPVCSHMRRPKWSALWPFMMSLSQSQMQKPLIYKIMCSSGRMVKTCILFLIHKQTRLSFKSVIQYLKLWIEKNGLSVVLGDPCPQPTQLNASMLHPCTNATKLNYFDGSKAGFGIFIIVLFLFPVGQYHTHKSIFFGTAILLISLISSFVDYFTFS